jgi:hypothetical protein
MKSIFKPRNAVSEIEAEIRNLEKRRAEITTRIGNDELALQQARDERREALSTDGSIDELTKRYSEITSRLADLKVVLDDIDTQGADAIARLTKARDKAERTAAAEELEKVASNAEMRLPEIEKAAAVFAKAISGLRSDLGENVSFWPSYNANRPEGSPDERKDRATAREVAAGIVAEVLARSMPWLFETVSGRHGYRSSISRIMDPRSTQPDWVADQPSPPLSAREVMQSLVCTPLREQALGIRDGIAAPAEPAQKAVVDDYVRPQAPANVSVFVIVPFSFFASEFGPPEVLEAGWVKSVPEPVAVIAEAQKLCVQASSDEGQAFLDRQGSTEIVVKPGYVAELGDVMHLRTPTGQVVRQAGTS